MDFFNDVWKENNAFAGGNGNNRSTQQLGARPVKIAGDKYDPEFAGVLGFFVMLYLALF
jgi:hypothetical protein